MNECKFSGKGDIYAKARPSYPNSLFDYLQKNYLNYVDEIKDVFKKHSMDGKVVYPYVTRCFIGKV